MESSPSRSSSGCQSGWTLYLDHSDGHRCIPYCAPAQRWMVPRGERTDGADGDEEDSMASDASSGPRPRLRDEDDEARRDFELRRHGFFVDQRSYSTSSDQRSSASSSGSFASSTWSRSIKGGAMGDVARRAVVVVQGDEATTRQYREIIVIDDDEDDELDDTASSSAVFSCPMPMVHVHAHAR